jgi:hypothetical protein
VTQCNGHSQPLWDIGTNDGESSIVFPYRPFQWHTPPMQVLGNRFDLLLTICKVAEQLISRTRTCLTGPNREPHGNPNNTPDRLVPLPSLCACDMTRIIYDWLSRGLAYKVATRAQARSLNSTASKGG